MSCPTCGQELPGRPKFCSECGTPLSVEPARRREERKVVSVLFCDLVNFTAASESADPEDVRARLVPYYAMLRDRVEAFDGNLAASREDDTVSFRCRLPRTADASPS